jgi:hypothetical protein
MMVQEFDDGTVDQAAGTCRMKMLVSDELWAVLEPLVPPAPSHTRGGRAHVSEAAAPWSLP